MNSLNTQAVIEAVLFASGQPVTISSLCKLTNLTEQEITQAVSELKGKYSEHSSGIMIAEIAEGLQMLTNPEYAEWIRKYLNINQSSRLSQSALETLAIIAYKQPIIKAEIDSLRGRNSDSAIKGLLERRLIKVVGKKESPGRPLLYGTTREFLQYFGLKSLADLPPVEVFLKDETA